MILRAILCDRAGQPLTELEPEVEFFSWRLNGPGMARFSLSMSDPKCHPELLQPGNRILFQSTVLPDWGGVIDLPLRITHGRLTLTAYTPEKILAWRCTPRSLSFRGVSPGHIFRTLLEVEDADFPLGIVQGTIYEGGVPRWTEYHYHDLLARIQDLANLSGNDFAVLPCWTGNELLFVAHWYELRGLDKTQSVVLLEGANISEVVVDEQGSMANRVILVGAGSGWDDDRITAIVEDTASISRYGLREYAEVQVGVVEQTTLNTNAVSILQQRKAPLRRFSLSVVDAAPGRFAEYDIGDRVRLCAFLGTPYYCDTTVRVLAREWTASGCRLEVEEWAH